MTPIKRRIIKHLALLLCVAMLLGMTAVLSVGCTDDTQPQPDEPKVPTVILAENGQSAYSIMRMDYDPDRLVTNACVKLRQAIEAATGANCEIKSDWVNRGETVPTDTLEILVGETNRQESIDAYATLGENEYLIALKGHRLVIIGQTEEATVEAVNVFIREYLGYDEASDTYTKTVLAVPETLAQSGNYVKPAPIVPDTPVKPTVPGEYGPQNAQTIPFESYVTPTYALENGVYVHSYEDFEVTGVRTTFQANTLYSDVYNIHTGSVMVYSTADANFQSWYSSGDYVVDMMIAINRAGKDYLELDEDNYNDIQMDSGGNYIVHTANQAWYMVPSLDWIEYAWEEMLKPMIETYHPQTIALEEPEMWIRSGYSETFKEEWEEFYGEKWQAPSSSAAANLKANLLKTYLFERILIELSSRAKELDPTIQIYVASHSTVNYTAWNINAGLNTYLATGAIDGVIGQTWADTHNSAFKYNGTSIKDNFTNAFIEYCSYVDSVEGTNFYALADPMADGKDYKEEDLQYIYRQSVAAKLMQPEIHRFQVLPWVQRAFANVSADYRTVQSQIYEMLNQIGGQEITMETGTPGIAYLASDSLSWMNAGSGWALSTSEGMYGLCAPLVRDGIPVKMKAMEQIYTKDDLKGVNLLLVSFDSSVPLSEEVNIAIADWVKAGGTMLYIAGQNDYWDIDDYFFWADDVTPLDNLMKHLGLNIAVNTASINFPSALTSPDSTLSAVFANVKPATGVSRYSVSFEGAKNPILRSGTTVLGFEETVGKGHVVMVGLPSAWLATTQGGSSFMRALTAYALQFTDFEYVSSPMMVTRRGDYVAAHAFAEGEFLVGSYIDLFDSNLSVLQDPDVPKDDSVILYDIGGIVRDMPRLGYTSGQVLDLVEASGKTTIKMTSAANVNVSIRMLLPKNTYPSAVTVTDANGKSYPALSYFYDKDSTSCLIKVDGNSDYITVTVDWCDDPSAFSLISKEFVEDSYLTNANDAQDVDFIEPESTAAANHGVRFCDGSLQLIYKFDLTEYDTPLFRFHVSQNYYVEVSADKKDWTLVVDYSNGGTVERMQNGANAEVLTIDPADYGLTDTMYFRLKNTATTGGFGGAISQFSIRHMIEKEGDSTAQSAPANRLVGVNNTTANIRDDIKRNASSDDNKYLVSTKDGIATFKRSMKTSTANQDEAFIYANTAGANDGLRFCDGDRVLIYYFDLNGLHSAEIQMKVLQNYIVEVSGDAEDWTIVADYSKGGTVPHLTTGGNQTTITIDPSDYDCEGACYVRLRNSDPSKGWGGSITNLTFIYQKKV